MKKKITSLLGGWLLLCVLLAPITVQAEGALFDGRSYVVDPEGYLYPEELANLEKKAAGLSEAYGCGLYLAVVDDIFEEAAPGYYDAFDAGTDIYTRYQLGLGSDRNGMLLILSMDERDYALVAYGDLAHAAFTDYGKDVLSDVFLSDFAYDLWYDGFDNYLDKCGELLQMAAEGTYFDYDTDPANQTGPFEAALIALLPAAVVTVIAGLIAAGSMKSVKQQRSASTYMVRDSLNMGRRVDLYTHTTESRQPIRTESSSRGGTTIRSGGFSGKSGKF